MSYQNMADPPPDRWPLRFLFHRVTRNLIFWLLFAALPVSLNWGNYGSKANFYTDLLFYGEVAFLGYCNNLLLIPYLMDRGAVKEYCISATFLLLFVTYAGLFWLTPLVSDYTSRLTRPHVTFLYNLTDYGFFLGSFTGAALLSRLASAQRRTRRLTELQRETELAFLNAQINPHFLFNTLNMMYSHAQEGSPVVPDLVVGLADSMRYALHEGQARRVSLSTEIRFLRNYVELQRLRLEDRATVSFRDETRMSRNLKVAPLLLIVLVENAFKYATANQVDNIDIQLHLLVISNRLYFRVSNSLDPNSPPPLSASSGGIGLTNLRKRLRLIYGRTPQLVTRRHHDRYHAEIVLPLE